MKISFGIYEKQFQDDACKMCRWKEECPEHNDDSCVQEYISWINTRCDYTEAEYAKVMQKEQDEIS